MKNIEIIKSNFIENQKINLTSVNEILPSIESATDCLIRYD